MSLFRFGFKRAGEVNKGNSDKIDEVDQEGNKGGEQTENQTAGAYSKQATPRDKYKKRKMVGRGFRKEWLKEFPWLQYKEEQSQMQCKVRNDFPNIADKSSSFFNGSKSFHVSNIKGHQQSCRHARCMEAKKAREAPEATPIHIGLRNLDD